jgi:hypothetical protein
LYFQEIENRQRCHKQEDKQDSSGAEILGAAAGFGGRSIGLGGLRAAVCRSEKHIADQ